MELIDEIKELAKEERYSLTSLGKAYNENYGTKFTQASFYRKVKTGNVTIDEYRNIMKILKYNVILEKQ